jgi:hypothetical protein
MAETDWAAVAIAFVGGSLATTIVKAAWEWWTRPIIKAQLLPGPECYHHTIQLPAKTPAHYLRIKVLNAGYSAIKGCAGYLTEIKLDLAGGQASPVREVLDLTWSITGSAPKNIPRGAFFILMWLR